MAYRGDSFMDDGYYFVPYGMIENMETDAFYLRFGFIEINLFSHKYDKFMRRNIPHMTHTGSCMCIPVWLAYIVGGTVDNEGVYSYIDGIIDRWCYWNS
jgi:hypothetical protein